MSSTQDDGGPAFPAPALGERDYGDGGAYPGMSLRDYFAVHASREDLVAALEDLGRTGGLAHCKSGAERNAVARFYVADKMLKARA